MKPRNAVFFHADQDVQDMIVKARNAGMSLRYMSNEALRLYLPKRLIKLGCKKGSK